MLGILKVAATLDKNDDNMNWVGFPMTLAEDEGAKDMDDQDLDWMAQGPLTLPDNIHKMP